LSVHVDVAAPESDSSGWFERRPVLVPFISSTVTLVITAAVTIFVTLWTTTGDGTSGTAVSTGLDTTTVVNVSSADLHQTNQLNTPDTPISGNLKTPLPSGAQLWAMSRQALDAHDEGAIAYGPVRFGPAPCKVDTGANSFDCGRVYLGDTKATYFVWITLFDSTDASTAVRTFLPDQAKNNYNHRAPENTHPVGPIVYSHS
jgi:hypothetical protein